MEGCKTQDECAPREVDPAFCPSRQLLSPKKPMKQLNFVGKWTVFEYSGRAARGLRGTRSFHAKAGRIGHHNCSTWNICDGRYAVFMRVRRIWSRCDARPVREANTGVAFAAHLACQGNVERRRPWLRVRPGGFGGARRKPGGLRKETGLADSIAFCAGTLFPAGMFRGFCTSFGASGGGEGCSGAPGTARRWRALNGKVFRAAKENIDAGTFVLLGFGRTEAGPSLRSSYGPAISSVRFGQEIVRKVEFGIRENFYS